MITDRPIIYLAGGMRTGWQKHVIVQLGEKFSYFDPCSHGLKCPKDYVKYDFELIGKSDIVFAYFEKTNPSGFGLAAEIGYAKGLGKRILLVNQKCDKYSVFLNYLAERTFETLDDGVKFLANRGIKWVGKTHS